jgi:hypothetical protein
MDDIAVARRQSCTIDLCLDPFRVGRLLANECPTTQAIHQSGREIAIRQIAFQSHTLGCHPALGLATVTFVGAL